MIKTMYKSGNNIVKFLCENNMKVETSIIAQNIRIIKTSSGIENVCENVRTYFNDKMTLNFDEDAHTVVELLNVREGYSWINGFSNNETDELLMYACTA